MSAPDCVLATRGAVRDSVHAVDRVLVAVSGGPDSLALAAATAWVAQREGIRASAVVVDHGLQQDSSAIAQWAADVCMRLGLGAARVMEVAVGAEGGPEAAAREARYAALAAAAADEQADAVLLGHTLEDQAETVLLRLARGSGTRSLSGMRAANGIWRRPFLELPRSLAHEAAAWSLAAIGEQAWRDPHNEDARFARSRLRALWPALVDALGPGITSGLARTADQARDDADALDGWAEEFASADPAEGLEVAVLAGLPRAVRTRALRALIAAAGAPMDALDFEHVLAVDRLVTQWRGQGPVSLPGRLRGERECGKVRIRPEREDERGR